MCSGSDNRELSFDWLPIARQSTDAYGIPPKRVELIIETALSDEKFHKEPIQCGLSGPGVLIRAFNLMAAVQVANEIVTIFSIIPFGDLPPRPPRRRMFSHYIKVVPISDWVEAISQQNVENNDSPKFREAAHSSRVPSVDRCVPIPRWFVCLVVVWYLNLLLCGDARAFVGSRARVGVSAPFFGRVSGYGPGFFARGLHAYVCRCFSEEIFDGSLCAEEQSCLCFHWLSQRRIAEEVWSILVGYGTGFFEISADRRRPVDGLKDRRLTVAEPGLVRPERCEEVSDDQFSRGAYFAVLCVPSEGWTVLQMVYISWGRSKREIDCRVLCCALTRNHIG